MSDTAEFNQETEHIDRLLDAIEYIKADRYSAARAVLRDLIRDYNNFEDAWLWMSVTVESLDQSEICLDNVLRINPSNTQASIALYRLRESEMLLQRRRSRLRLYRDVALGMMWALAIGLSYAVLFSYF